MEVSTVATASPSTWPFMSSGVVPGTSVIVPVNPFHFYHRRRLAARVHKSSLPTSMLVPN